LRIKSNKRATVSIKLATLHGKSVKVNLNLILFNLLKSINQKLVSTKDTNIELDSNQVNFIAQVTDFESRKMNIKNRFKSKN
jgi:hypothetical protein